MKDLCLLHTHLATGPLQCHNSMVDIHQTHPVSQSITPVASAELPRPTRKKLSEFLATDLDSTKLTSHAGRAEVVTTVIKCGLPFFVSLNAK